MHRDATFALHPLVEHAVKQGAAVVAERGAGVCVHLEPVLGPRALYKQHTRYLCVRYTYCNLFTSSNCTSPWFTGRKRQLVLRTCFPS